MLIPLPLCAPQASPSMSPLQREAREMERALKAEQVGVWGRGRGAMSERV